MTELARFSELADRLRMSVYGLAYRFFGNHDDAEDATQEVMLRLWEIRQTLLTARNAEALIHTVTKNYCVSLWRKRQVEAVSIDEVRDVSTPSTPLSLMQEREDEAWLHREMERLPAASLRLWQMKQEQGLSTEEISRLTGIAAHSVSSMIADARRRLLMAYRKRQETKH